MFTEGFFEIAEKLQLFADGKKKCFQLKLVKKSWKSFFSLSNFKSGSSFLN
jgi:hypothetical protein